MSFIAALPMYEWPETRDATDMEWTRFRDFFRHAGIDAPETIVRRNAEMPPVPGGIRDAEGKVIAADPATLPPDELHFPTLWRHPDLLLCQTCWGPLELGLEQHVRVVGQPSYNGFEGGQKTLYSSAIVMRVSPNPPWMEAALKRGATAKTASERELAAQRRGVDKPSPDDGLPDIPLNLIRGKRFAFNSLDSMSGIIAAMRDLEAMGESLDIFSERIETGSHRGSVIAVAEGTADVASIDCRTWHMAELHEPKAADVQVVGWTGLRKGLPMITSLHTPEDVLEKLIDILSPP
jgi:ABC-type phosphate/phosphonate transport system substrate-binding protein